jgi:hypothetical protein
MFNSNSSSNAYFFLFSISASSAALKAGTGGACGTGGLA